VFAFVLAGEAARKATRLWPLFLVMGIAWILTAMIIFRFDYLSVAAVAFLFGCVAIAAGIGELLVASISRGGWVVFHGLLGVLFAVVGFIAFLKPGGTFVGLAAMFSFYLTFLGIFTLINAFMMDAASQTTRWVLGLSGVAYLALGFWAASGWRTSATVLVAFTGAIALVQGVNSLLFGLQLYKAQQLLEPEPGARRAWDDREERRGATV
jgi:uncharacterized membrane protein HdeD (DUF308 family)